MKVHNKFEVTLKSGKKVCAFNRMFSSIYQALALFNGFALYVSVGDTPVDETTHVGSLENEHMTGSLGVFASVADGYNLNPCEGPLYGRRKIVIPQNVLVGKDLSEIGFCELPTGCTAVHGEPENPSTITTENTSPQLFNYAYFVDENGLPTTVYKGEEALEIFATVYLDWDMSDGIMPLGGDNHFVKFLLGSPVYDGVAPTFDFGCGYDPRPNIPQVEENYHHISNNYISRGVTPVINVSDTAIEFFFSSTHARAFLPEICLVANGDTVVRQNRFGEQTSSTYTDNARNISDDGTLLLAKYYVGDILSITDQTAEVTYTTPEELAAFKREDLPGEVCEPIAPVFGDKDYDLSDDWNVTTSKCGKMIAFSCDTAVDIYEIDDGIATAKDTAAIARKDSITDIEFFDEYIFVSHSSAPYVECYKWVFGVLEKMHLLLDEALSTYASGSSFTFATGQSISFGKMQNGNILCAVKLDADTVKILVFEESNRLLLARSCFSVPMTEFNFVAALSANKETDCQVVLAGKDNTQTNTVYTYTVSAGMQLVSSSYAAYEFNNNVESYVVGQNFVYLRRTDSPLHTAWYFPENRRYTLVDAAGFQYSFGKNSKILARFRESTTVIDGMYQRKLSTPVATVTKLSNEFFLNKMLGFIVVNNGILVFRDEAPYCVLYNHTTHGFVTLSGLDPTHTYQITYKLGKIQYEYENCFNHCMSLVLSGAGED